MFSLASIGGPAKPSDWGVSFSFLGTNVGGKSFGRR